MGNVSGAGIDVKQQAAAAAKKSKKLVFPRFVVATGEVITSQFGKLRTYQNNRGEVVRRVHAGTDYDLSSNFCHCSAGWYKLYWDQIFEQPVKVETVKSALNNDMECTFTIQIPDNVISKIS